MLPERPCGPYSTNLLTNQPKDNVRVVLGLDNCDQLQSQKTFCIKNGLHKKAVLHISHYSIEYAFSL